MNNTVVDAPNAFVTAPTDEGNPWHRPKTIRQNEESESYSLLKQRLATVPTRSRHSRQALYIDLWTGQHWLGLALSGPAPAELLKPVSTDTALSIARNE